MLNGLLKGVAKPTPRAEWVRVGDKCESIIGGMTGVVLKVVNTRSLPYAVVKWSSGSTGRHTITTLRRVMTPR